MLERIEIDGQKMKLLRGALPAQELAKRAKVTPQAIHAIERTGKTTRRTLAAIARVLKVRESDFRKE